MRCFLSLMAVLVLSFSLSAGDIHQAVLEGDFSKVKVLLEADRELLNKLDDTGKSALHHATYNGKSEIAEYLVNQGADVNVKSHQNSVPLHGAAYYGHLESVKLLVKNGADVNLPNNYGYTPLLSSAAAGHLELVKVLLNAGADINVVVSRNEANVLLVAGSSGNNELVEYLLKRGFDINVKDNTGEGLIHYGAYGGDLDLVKKLVSKGVNVNSKSNEGLTPLHYAAQGSKLDVLKYLVENGADPKLKDNEGEAAIHKVIAWSRDDDTTGMVNNVVKYLVDNGVDVNTTNNWNQTAIHWSIYRGNLELMEYLINKNADMHIKTESGLTALHEAVRRNRLEMAQSLINYGADTDIKDDKLGFTPLHDAALSGSPEMVKAILKGTKYVNSKDKENHTPLYYAAKYGHKQVADLLKNNGAKERNLVENYSSAKALNKKINNGEALLWYLGHVGWAIKTQNHLLVFDYWTRDRELADPCLANGYLTPDEIRGQNIELFVTHEHGDHYDKKIFELQEAIPELSFIFGFQHEDLGQSDPRGYAGQTYEYIEAHQNRTIDGMTVTPIVTNDAGQGFLVEVDGLTIYHAGDHAGWREGEREGFTSEIDFLASLNKNIDFAFVNVTGCHVRDTVALAEATYYTIDKLDPKILVPTHGIDREYVYKEYADKIHANGYKLDVLCAKHRGDKFVYKDDQIM